MSNSVGRIRNQGVLRVSPVPSSPFRREILVDSPRGKRVLYWSVDDESLPIGTEDLLDDALVALIPLAQFHGWRMHLEGDVTREQVANMREYQEAWVALRPDIYSMVDITYRNALPTESATHPRTAVLAYSGGVDSTHAAVTGASVHRGRRALEITRGVLIAGFDIGLDDTASIARAHGSAQHILNKLEIPLVVVSTNWREDFSPNYTMSFGLGLAAVLHQFRATFDAGLIATDATYATEVGAWGRDSTINRMSGSRAFPFPTIGATASRRDKITAISHIDVVREHLRVCWQPNARGANCGHCGKCVRTKLGFAASGYPATAALGSTSPEEVASVALSMWDRIFLEDMLVNPGELDAGLLTAIRQRISISALPSTHDSTQGRI
ncbi:MAG: 7-cyano-7-deazaguanine synthase [Actinomycetia bacterium]|nr:7-cyano-7-deazaguanine synthase [Actinomycetes bacterium]